MRRRRSRPRGAICVAVQARSLPPLCNEAKAQAVVIILD